MPDPRLPPPNTTFRRALLAIALCSVAIAVVPLAITVSSGPPSAYASSYDLMVSLAHLPILALLFGMWATLIFVFLAVFAGIPWALLHGSGARSWWVAPLAGFAIAFCLGFWLTPLSTSTQLELGSLRSFSVGGKDIIVDGRLTPYGASLRGPVAAARQGIAFGGVGATLALLLWCMAYRRRAD